MPALVARRYHPLIRTFCDRNRAEVSSARVSVSERLLANGKSTMAVIGTAMHKLWRQVFGVLKSGQPFNPDFLTPPS
jgi:transposase